MIALGLALLWLGDLVPPLIEGTQPTIIDELGEQATVSHAIDLAVLVLALSIAGYWLWQRRPWGYVVGGVVLLLGTLLAPSITGMTVVLILEGEITVSVWGIVFTMLPLVIAAALAINYLLAFGGKKPPQSTDGIPATDEPDA